MSVLGVILAGGLARRMGGGDKALLRVAGETLLERAARRLGPQCDRGAILNANGDPERFSKLSDLPVVADATDERAGPLAGVLAGLRAAPRFGASHVVTVAVDTPFFPADLVARLEGVAREAAVPLACAKTGDRTHPVFGLWPVALADDLAAAMADGMRKVDRWTGRHGCAEAVFTAEPFDPFFNINTPDDLARAEELAA